MTCTYPLCNKKIETFCFCRYCQQNYCIKHRLPEVHNCRNINDIKNEKLKILTKNILDSKIVPQKIAPI